MNFTDKQKILIDTLKILGLEPTVNRLSFLVAWNMAEGSRSINNPLNTTLPMKTDKGMTNFNSAGVKNYSTPAIGARATAATLKLKYYKPILDELKVDSNPVNWIDRSDVKAALKTWGTTNNVISKKLRDSKFMVAIQAGIDKLRTSPGTVAIIVFALIFVSILFYSLNQNTTT